MRGAFLTEQFCIHLASAKCIGIEGSGSVAHPVASLEKHVETQRYYSIHFNLKLKLLGFTNTKNSVTIVSFVLINHGQFLLHP